MPTLARPAAQLAGVLAELACVSRQRDGLAARVKQLTNQLADVQAAANSSHGAVGKMPRMLVSIPAIRARFGLPDSLGCSGHKKCHIRDTVVV